MNPIIEALNLLKIIADKDCSPAKVSTGAGVGSIPAGYKSVAITKTSPNTDSVIITLSDGSTYTMTEQGEYFADGTDPGQRLPAYPISGTGTIKWHGIK